MGDAGQELRVGGQPAVQRVPGLSQQAHRELVLKHDDSGAEPAAVRQQLEGQRRADLVGDVGHAYVEVRQFCLFSAPPLLLSAPGCPFPDTCASLLLFHLINLLVCLFLLS